MAAPDNSINEQFWSSARLPMLLQTEGAECGLACLAMISSYWGKRVSIAELRRVYSLSMKGMTLSQLVGVASDLQLQPRPLRVEMAHLRELQLPCVLHWDLNHFVVLKRVGAKSAIIHDPKVGIRSVSVAQLSNHFSGIALEVRPAPGFESSKTEVPRVSFWSLMGRVYGLKRGLGQMVALGIALQLCALLAPLYMQVAIDDVVVSGDRGLLVVLAIAFGFLVLLTSILSALRSWVTALLSVNLSVQWLGNVFTHLMSLPLPYFQNRHLGDIISRFGSISVIQRAITTQFVDALIDGALVIGTLYLMLNYNAWLTAIAVAAVLLYFLVRASVFRTQQDATAEQIVHESKQSTQLLESARGVQSIRLFNRANERRATWYNSMVDQFNASLRVNRISIATQTANQLLFGIERVAVIFLGVAAILASKLSVGMLFAFLVYKTDFTARLTGLVDRLFDWKMLRLHGDRVSDIVLAIPENVSDTSGGQRLSEPPSIEFRNICFRYADSEPLVLKDVSLVIPPGQCVAVTGPSGCGKTTLIKILLGLLEPVSGQVLINGIELRQFGVRRFRQGLGAVMQDDQLFAGTIAENISFFDQMESEEQVLRCARLAAFHEEIAKMPMAYNTLIGDIGTGLSGGQKQRVLLARAMYVNPVVFVLDEASSHLDADNERLINAAIMATEATRLIIAHRQETVILADRILKMDGGQIVSDAVVQRTGSINLRSVGFLEQ
jgi:ATP-binding cassette subfamily B protein RaxB